MISCLLLLLLVRFCTISGECPEYCDSHLECSNETLTCIGGNGKIEGHGYKSSYGQDSQLLATTIRLYGSNSGEYASSIDGSDTWCSAFKSCANVESLISDTDDLWCDGAASCIGSHMMVPNQTGALNCYGDISCAFSFINDTYIVDARGIYSLYSAVIDSPGDVFLYGKYSGYNATIYSNKNKTSSVHCFGNGCFGLKLICNSDTDCNNFNISGCDDVSVTCPELVYKHNNGGILINTLPQVYQNEIENGFDMIDRINDDCDENYGSLDDYLQGANSMIVNNHTSICCRGSYACLWSQLIINTCNSSITSNIGCTGTFSCQESTIIGNYPTSLNIFCLAWGSCAWSSMYLTDVSHNSTIYCGGYTSCEASYIYNVTNIFCNSVYSCMNTIIFQVQNAHFASIDSGLNATIYAKYSNNNGISVYFESFLSGRGVTIYCNRSSNCNIYCLANLACLNDEYYPTTVYCDSEKKSNCNIACYNGNQCPKIIDTSAINPGTTTVTTTTTTQITMPTIPRGPIIPDPQFLVYRENATTPGLLHVHVQIAAFFLIFKSLFF